MKKYILSVGYLVTIILFIVFIDYLFMILCNNILFKIFDWFNGISFLFKICIMSVLFGSILIIASIIPAILNLILDFFPKNIFTLISSFILSILNIIICTFALWNAIPKFTFWITIEFITIIIFINSFNLVFITRHKNSL